MIDELTSTPSSLAVQDTRLSTPALLRSVLLVEDEPDIQIVVQMALEVVGGLKVVLCDSGLKAAGLAADIRPDLILLDVGIPGLNGLQVLKQLQANVVTAATPVFFLTARAQPEELRSYRQAGAADVIAKPFDALTLPALLEEKWRLLHPV